MVALTMMANTSAVGTELWYEDNNLGKAGKMPVDFIDKFNNIDSFAKASHFIKVYMVRSNLLNQLDDQFLSDKFIPYLKKNNILLALDVGGATWMPPFNRISTFKYQEDQLKRLKKLGAVVSFISMQGALGKLTESQDVVNPEENRIKDVVDYSKLMQEIYPQVQIGIITSIGQSAGYRRLFLKGQKAMDNAGVPLAYMHLDMPFHIPKTHMRGVTWQKIRDFESFVENEMGIKFGMLTTSRLGGRSSDKEFHDDVLSSMQCYASFGGSPSTYLLMSWFAHPIKTVPENAIGDDYPAMRTMLDLGTTLEKIDRGELLSKSTWQSTCTIFN